MKTFSVVIIAMFMTSGLALAKPAFKAAVGAKDCKDCHVPGKFKEPNPSNKMWATAKDMAAKMKEGKGDFAGKTDCNSCHQGQPKPPKK
jgi:hypothetical protein